MKLFYVLARLLSLTTKHRLCWLLLSRYNILSPLLHRIVVTAVVFPTHLRLPMACQWNDIFFFELACLNHWWTDPSFWPPADYALQMLSSLWFFSVFFSPGLVSYTGRVVDPCFVKAWIRIMLLVFDGRSFRRKKIRIVTAIDLIKCHRQIK